MKRKKDTRKRLGALGESLAAELLKKKGMTILARNWRCRFGEIDIIAQDGRTLVVVEVKTRRGAQAGPPEEGVDARKQAQLCRLAQYYVEQVNWKEEVRLDIVAVAFSSQGTLLRITHWPHAIECWDIVWQKMWF